ncbi:glycoside hydrolase superfamily [Aspergillus alliaceus]|uniref:Glycoside hydrolase superfamily n=1 Tax=Petromyces alliaceus TaxID=209559 RepID=A0A5N7C4K1_PETAA|nr:glycoside hydrolase superfamily [Aspergillus alliaceus]
MLYWVALLLFCHFGISFSLSTVRIPLANSARVLRRDLYGYSIEPSSVVPYLQNDRASKLLGYIAEVAGVPASIRVGGNIADQTLFDKTLRAPSEALPNDTTVEVLRIREDWFKGWKEYFPHGTNILYTLNLRNETGLWINAMEEAKAVMGILGESLSHFELGNEIDHYINKGWRGAGWDTKQYTNQWRRLTSQILSSPFYQNATHQPLFQAAVFADPPMVPDQHDEIDDFDIINVTRAGLVDTKIIDSYAVHLYPQSTCDAVRRRRLSLDLLSDHNVIWTNLSQYIPQEAAARAAGSRLVLGETNSASCSGKSGISDTLGAALWAADYVLTAASIGIEQTYFHLGHQSEYSAFTPLPYVYKGEKLTAGIRANFFSHIFLAHVVSGGETDTWKITALPSANASDFSGYAIFGGQEEPVLAKLVFIDLGVWNSTSGLHNPSTLSATDSKFVSPGARPRRTVEVHTTWYPGTEVELLRLQGPGTNAKSGVNVSGVALDLETGTLVGKEEVEPGIVSDSGIVRFDISQAEGVLIQKRRTEYA